MKTTSNQILETINTFKQAYENGDLQENENVLSMKLTIGEYLGIEKHIPDFQRSGNQWDGNKALDLFTTISLNEPLPKFILAIMNSDERYFLMDGQQRTNTFELLLSAISKDSQADMNAYMIDVDVVYFNDWKDMASYYLRVNASSGLTQAQKLKAELSEDQLSVFNVINYDTNMVELLQSERDCTNKNKNKKDDDMVGDTVESVELSYIKNGKTEELSYILLSIANTNIKSLKADGFTTGAKANAEYIKSLRSIDNVEKVARFLEVYNRITQTRTSKSKLVRTQLISLLFQAYMSDTLDDSKLCEFVTFAYKEVESKNGNIRTVENSKLAEIFGAGTSNSKDGMKSKYNELVKFLKDNDLLKKEVAKATKTETKKISEPKKADVTAILELGK